MQHNDLDALIRQISQQCGDPAAAARLKARMQNPEQQRAARSMFRQHGASLEQATRKAPSKSYSARCRRRRAHSSRSKSPV